MTRRHTLAMFLAVLGFQAAAAEHELHLPIPADPGTLDSQRSASDVDFDIERDLFEGLMTLSPIGRPVPGAAESWEVSPDNLTWTFHIRDDARWSDGAPVTAEDFVYSFRREIDPATASPFAETLTPFAGAAEVIAGKIPPADLGVTALDPHTLKIQLVRPTPWLLPLLAHYSTLPVPHGTIERFGDQWTRPGNMVSNGAYKLDAWVPHGELVISRNPYFHHAAEVRAETVRRVLADDPHVAIRQWEAGELDLAPVPDDALADLSARFPDQIRTTPWLATYFIELNLDKPELQDRRVRQALSMAIDRETLAHKVQRGMAMAAVELIPPDGFPGCPSPKPDWASLSMPERIATARRLLVEAGGHPLHLMIRIDHEPEQEKIARTIATMLHATLGITVDVDGSERRVWTADMLHRNFQAALATWTADYFDPWNFLENWRSDQVGMNWDHYQSPVYDGFLDRSRTAPDEPARMQLMAEAEATMLADQPIIPIEHRAIQVLLSPHLGGWELSPVTMHLSRYLYWKE